LEGVCGGALLRWGLDPSAPEHIQLQPPVHLSQLAAWHQVDICERFLC